MKHAIEGWVLAATVASGCGASLASPSARPDVLTLEAPRRFDGGAGPAVALSLAGVTEETFQSSPDDPERAGVAASPSPLSPMERRSQRTSSGARDHHLKVATPPRPR